MGMSIDDAIKYYSNKNVVLTEEEAEANTIALNTMRKYQKIEQIVNAEFEEYHPLDRNIYRLALIRKVLKDGNDD